MSYKIAMRIIMLIFVVKKLLFVSSECFWNCSLLIVLRYQKKTYLCIV